MSRSRSGPRFAPTAPRCSPARTSCGYPSTERSPRSSGAVSAVDAADVATVTGARFVRVVRPVALDAPARAVLERDQLRAELPRALVGVLRAAAVVPRVEVVVGQRLRELVA